MSDGGSAQNLTIKDASPAHSVAAGRSDSITSRGGARRAVSIRRAFALVTSLFFLWGMAFGLLDVLNKHFQEALGISQAKSGLLQAAFFAGYFTAAIPASMITRRLGYKGGILTGLVLYCIGALLFIPATYLSAFGMFLFALYVIACGLACLETSSNPYVIALGPPSGAPGRLNFSQAFYGVGSLLGPMIGGLILFGKHGQVASGESLATLRHTYIGIALVVGLIALLIASTPMPEITPDKAESSVDAGGSERLRDHPAFWAGVVTLFVALAGQVGEAAFFINYATQAGVGITSQNASFLLALGMGLFTIGRFVTPLVMRWMQPGHVLSLYSAAFTILVVIGVSGLGMFSVACTVVSFFFTSTLFPTVFALSVAKLGPLTKRGSPILVMAVCGCGILPVIMGQVADRHGAATALLLPAAAFLFPLWFGLAGSRLRPRRP